MDDFRPVIIKPDGSQVKGVVSRPGDKRVVSLGERDLIFVRIDHQVRLQFEDVEVVIESPFTLVQDAAMHRLEPAERRGLGPLLGIYPDSLLASSVDNAGTLQLRFKSGATIEVTSDPLYEAWQVVGPGSNLVVCIPGTKGELAIWS